MGRCVSTYSEKLRDPRWQKKRLEIMQRDHFRCRVCHSEEDTLNVHHIVYAAKEPWDSEDDDLVTVCEDCHGVVKHCETAGQRRSFEAILKQAWMCGRVAAGECFMVEGKLIDVIPRTKKPGPVQCVAKMGSPFPEKATPRKRGAL